MITTNLFYFIFIDVYEDDIVECGPTAVSLFQRLSERVNEEIELNESLLAVEGCVDLLISASSAGKESSSNAITTVLKPMENSRNLVRGVR